MRASKVRGRFFYGEAPQHEEKEWTVHNWLVRLSYQGRKLTVPFYGAALVTHVTTAEVVGCILLDANSGTETFEDFCAVMGYDLDSRKAESVWRSCGKMADKLRRFLGADFSEALAGGEEWAEAHSYGTSDD